MTNSCDTQGVATYGGSAASGVRQICPKRRVRPTPAGAGAACFSGSLAAAGRDAQHDD